MSDTASILVRFLSSLSWYKFSIYIYLRRFARWCSPWRCQIFSSLMNYFQQVSESNSALPCKLLNFLRALFHLNLTRVEICSPVGGDGEVFISIFLFASVRRTYFQQITACCRHLLPSLDTWIITISSTLSYLAKLHYFFYCFWMRFWGIKCIVLGGKKGFVVLNSSGCQTCSSLSIARPEL